MSDDSKNDFFEQSGTRSNQNFFLGQDIIDYFLGGCARSRMKHVQTTAKNLAEISSRNDEIEAELVRLKTEIDEHGDSGVGSMFLAFDTVRKVTRLNLEQGELSGKWDYWWYDYLQQLEIIARHIQLVEAGHINHPLALEFKKNCPDEGHFIDENFDFESVPESIEDQLRILAEKHREYFQDIIREKDHALCGQDYYTVEFLSFIIAEVIPGGLKKRFPTDIDAKILEMTHRLYYNEG